MRRLALIVVWLVALVAAGLAMPDGASAHPGHQHSVAPASAPEVPVADTVQAAFLPVFHGEWDRLAGIDVVFHQSEVTAFEPGPKPCLGGCCTPMSCLSCCVAVVGQSPGEPVPHATAAQMNGAEPTIGEGLPPPTDCEPPRRLV